MLLLKQFFIITIALMHFTLCIRNGRELKNDIDIKGRQSFFPKNDNEQSNQYENYNYINNNNNNNLNSQYFSTNDIASNNFKFSNDLRDQYDNGNNGIQFNDAFNQGEYFIGNNPNLDINNYINNGYDGPPITSPQQQTQQPSFNQQSSYFQTNPSNIDNYAQYYNYQNYPQSSFDGQQSIASAPPSQPPSRPPSRPYKKRKRPYPRPSSFNGQYQESPYQGPPLSGLPPAQRPYYSQQTYSPYPYDSSSSFYPQQNYANDYNQYQLNDGGGGAGNGITNFLQNIGQGAANLFSGNAGGGDYNPNLSNYGQYNPGFPGRPGPLPQQQQPSGPLGQFARVIEDITRNDDYQCIPKVLCQMVGSQRRQNVQSSILSSPIFSALISAVPSTTSSLVFGRAALLGYTSGEHSCDGAYPKCPRNEDDLLYYLNNHRGGFFRFFNGGAAFGDDVNYQYNPNPLQQNSPQHQQNNQPQSALGQLSALQSLADSINSGSGINLSNLGSNGALLGNLASLIGSAGGGGGGAAGGGGGLGGLGGLASLGNLAALTGGQNTLQSPVGTSLFGGAGGSGLGGINGGSVTELLGNLLTGFVGNRFSSRKIKKRSIINDNSTVNPTNSTVDELRFIINVPSSVEDNLNNTETNSDNVIDILLLPDEEILSGKQSISKKRDLSEDLEEIISTKGIVNKNETIIDICKNCTITIEDEKDSKEIESNEISEDDNEHVDDEGASVVEDDDDYQFPDVEARIVNAKQLLQSEDTMDKDNLVIFPPDDDDLLRDGKYLNIITDNDDFVKSTIFTFDNDNRDKANVKFIENINDFQLQQQPQFQQSDGPVHIKFPDIATNRFSKKLDDNDDNHPIRTRMIFPDRTGTGNLRFDNDYINHNYYSNRFGKILTGIKSDNNDNSNNDDEFYFSSQNNNNNKNNNNDDNNKYNNNNDNNKYNNNNGNEYNKMNYYRPSGQQQTTLASYGNQYYQPEYLAAPIAVYPAANNKYNDKYGNENNYQNQYSSNNNNNNNYNNKYNNQNTNSANNAVNKFPSLLSALFGINNNGGISNTGSSYPASSGSSSNSGSTNSNLNYSNYNYSNNNKYNNNNNNNQYVRNEDTSQNVYVTNSKGVIEYYINANGKKVYV